MKLTRREIDLLTCPPGRKDALFTDDDVRGFALRVTKTGSKVFLFQYRRGHTVQRVVIGRHGETSPTAARRKAEQLRGIVAGGGDPVADKAADLEARKAAAEATRQATTAAALTLARLVDQWVAIGLRDRSAAHRYDAPAALKRSLAQWWEKPAAAITTAEAQRHIDDMGQRTPTMAKRVRAYARAAYNWAMRRDLVAHNPFAPVAIEAREASRDRALNDAELGALWNACGKIAYPFGPLLRLLILTLQRRTEVAAMAWPEVSPDGCTWTLPASRSKNRRAHVVHLTAPARAILAAIPRLAGSDLIFTTTGRTPVSGFSHVTDRLRADLAEQLEPDEQGATPWRLHDFRRTGVTMLADLGIAPHVADRLLNHVGGSISTIAAVYQRGEFLAERKAALEQWAMHVLMAGEKARGSAPGPTTAD